MNLGEASTTGPYSCSNWWKIALSLSPLAILADSSASIQAKKGNRHGYIRPAAHCSCTSHHLVAVLVEPGRGVGCAGRHNDYDPQQGNLRATDKNIRESTAAPAGNRDFRLIRHSRLGHRWPDTLGNATAGTA